MPTRLLSFLSDIEQALLKESAASMGPVWTATRMVNYHQGLARMTLIPPPLAEEPAPHGGTILLLDGEGPGAVFEITLPDRPVAFDRARRAQAR